VDSKMTTDSEATVYTSARFRYLLYLLQVLPIVITVSFVLRTWRPHIHCRLSRRCGHVCLCEMCEFTLIVCRGNRPSCRGIISTTRNFCERRKPAHTYIVTISMNLLHSLNMVSCVARSCAARCSATRKLSHFRLRSGCPST